MTDVKLTQSGKVLAAYIQGEIDHHTAAILREKIDKAVCALMPDMLLIDFSAVSFMDSSGIGLVLGRTKLIKALGGECSVQNAPAGVAKMLKLAGVQACEKECNV